MPIELVITGGQTGADQGAWRAARAAGIRCSGWMPKGFLTEDGPRPEFAEMYGAREHKSPKYPPRTRLNVYESQTTLILGDPESPGALLVKRLLTEFKRSHFLWIVGGPPSHRHMKHQATADWITGENRTDDWNEPFRVVHVAGNRESSCPGIGAWVESYMSEVFRLLADQKR